MKVHQGLPHDMFTNENLIFFFVQLFKLTCYERKEYVLAILSLYIVVAQQCLLLPQIPPGSVKLAIKVGAMT